MATKKPNGQEARVGISASRKWEALERVRDVLRKAQASISRIPYGDELSVKSGEFRCSGSTTVMRHLFLKSMGDWLALPAKKQASTLLNLPAWMLYLLIHLPALIDDLCRARDAIKMSTHKAQSVEQDWQRTYRMQRDAASKREADLRKQLAKAHAKVEEIRETSRIVFGEMLQVIRNEERVSAQRTYWPGTAYAEVVQV